MSGSSPPPLSSLLTYDKLEPHLVAEMWGLLKALATQLRINMEPATPSSSSTATEPSPVQGIRHKDKAPTSLEDFNDDNKDISKSVPGGPLCQGLVLSSTTLACSTPGPSHCPTHMRILSGQSRRYPLVHTVPSPQTIMRDSPRRIWQRMGACQWTSTLSLSPSSTPCSCSWTHVTTSTSSANMAKILSVTLPSLTTPTLLENAKPAYLMPLHWPMPALLTGVPTETKQTRTMASKAARRRMPPLLTPANPTPRRRALVQPQVPSLISVPFPQSSITAPGDGGTVLQCPAKRRVLLCTAAE